ncbi:MAG: hypothetical protein PHW63_08270 [Alphaproteobacteria bacterium]|nr:hypothetical protein [Alphaproteobacteria bacterium]
MWIDILAFALSLYLVTLGSTKATVFAVRLAESLNLSRYTVGFIVVAVISILPETLISINSAFAGIPSFGLGTLFGSNIADLTLIYAIIILYAGRSLKVESKILKNSRVFPFMLFLPLILGLDGYFSRLEGFALIVTGAIFYYTALKTGADGKTARIQNGSRVKNSAFLLLSMLIILVGAHFTVTSATTIAQRLGINPILIGMLVVGLGTTLPELFFSIKAVKKRDDSLAIGDLLGTVLADATVVVGILAMVSPFYFPKKIIYITGCMMVVAAFILFRFMHTGRRLDKKEAFLLLLFWLCFLVVEFFTNT